MIIHTVKLETMCISFGLVVTNTSHAIMYIPHIICQNINVGFWNFNVGFWNFNVGFWNFNVGFWNFNIGFYIYIYQTPTLKFQTPTLKFSSRRKRRRDVAQTARYIQTPVAKVNVIRVRLAMIFSHRCGFSQKQRYINRGVMGGGVHYSVLGIQLHSWGLFVIVSDI